MKISLEYILTRNKTNLKHFIARNKISTYAQLLSICEDRDFIPVSREEFEKCVPPVKNEKNEKTNEKQPAKKAQPKRRRTSSTKRKRSTRASPKDVENS